MRCIQLPDQRWSAKCIVEPERGHVNVEIAEGRLVAAEIEADDPGFLVAEVGRRALPIADCAVDGRAQIRWRFPTEWVFDVLAMRYPQVVMAEALRAVSGEIQPMLVRRQVGAAGPARTIDVGPQMLRLAPRLARAFPLRHPDVLGGAEPSGTVGGDVQREPVIRDRRMIIVVFGIDDRAEVDRIGPGRKLAEPVRRTSMMFLLEERASEMSG